MASTLRATFASWAERSSLRRLGRLYPRALRAAYRAIGVAEESVETEEQLRQLEGFHIEWNPSDMRLPASVWTVLAVMPAVYFLDYLVFTPTTEYFAKSTFRSGSEGMMAAKLLVPAAILMLEVYVGTQLHLILKEGLRGVRWLQFIGWIGLALAMAVAMPAAVVTTILARQKAAAIGYAMVTSGAAGSGAGLAGLDPVHYWQTLCLVTLALVAHAGVIFAGRAAVDSKAYVIFRAKQRRLTARAKRLRALTATVQTAAADAIREYAATIDAHNRRFAAAVTATPYPNRVRWWINDQFGQERFQGVEEAPPLANGNEIPDLPDLPNEPSPAFQ